MPGIERGGDCIQSFGDGGGVERIPMEAGATGPCGGKRIFYCGHQSRRHRGAVEYWRVLWDELFLQSARKDYCGGGRDKDEVLTADLNLDEIAEVRRTWQFFRDRRPDLYGPIVAG